jgi:hypothetical protein
MKTKKCALKPGRSVTQGPVGSPNIGNPHDQLNSHFKELTTQERVDQIHAMQAKKDKQTAIDELRKFSQTLKLRKPMPAGATSNEWVIIATPHDAGNPHKEFAKEQEVNVSHKCAPNAKNNKEAKLNDLRKFGNTFQINMPIPRDLIPILSNDPAIQQTIFEKAGIKAGNAEKLKVKAMNQKDYLSRA